MIVIGAIAAWTTDSLAWGGLVGLGTWVLLNFVEFREFVRWSHHPLSRPLNRSNAWQSLADRLYRSLRHARTRTRTLLAELRRLQRTTDSLPDAWIILSPLGEIESMNAASRGLLGLSANDRGQNLVALLRDPEIVALFKGEIEGDLVEIAAPLDDARRLEVRRIPIGNDRQIVLARDVTELNRLLTMRQDFVANVSHELRTPLTVIMGYLEAAQEDDMDVATLRQLLEKMNAPTQRMKALVDDLLTLTRLESSPLPSDENMEDVVVAKLLESIVAEARALSGGDHEITLEADPTLSVRGIATELHSAFGNLVANAVRYSPGGGEVAVRWFASSAGPRFEVRDHGMGIAPEHLSRLTERFFRIDLAGARIRGGTGLGLAIVKHVLRRHQSVLQVESELGRGSLFFCVFREPHHPPLRVVPNRDAPQYAAPQPNLE